MKTGELKQPLVSCIMPTYNRRAFVPHAIRFFLEQDYDNKELLIVDDGTDSIKDLVPGHPQVRYINFLKTMTLGEKRNFCVKEGRGDLIMHWDDDDWMAPYRIRYQVTELVAQEKEICGLQKMFFNEIETGKCWLYEYPRNSKPWLAGGSLLYTKDFWKKSPFPNMQVASDTQFIFSRELESFVVLADHNFYVASIHENNTSRKATNNSLWRSIPSSEVEKIMGSDWMIYSASGQKKYHFGEEKKDGPPVQTQKNTVSACLLSFKRPGNIQKIIDSIHNVSFIDEILVWNNNPGCKLLLKGDKVRVIHSVENKICYGRFLCAKEARNDIIYFQDDDAIVNNVAELYHAFLKDDCRISYGLSSNHFRIRDQYDHYYGQVAFLGWGSFIRKEWIQVLDNYLKENETDYLFQREADKFFTVLLAKKNNAILAKLQLLEFDSTQGIALYLEKDHHFYASLAVRKALEFTRRSKKFIPPAWNVVITCMNYGMYLEESVHSVLYNQADYVITIVDDASTDDTAKICHKLVQKYPFINYIRNKQRMGTGFSRNVGIEAIDSLFVILLDADDKIGHRYLSESEKLLRRGFDVVNPDAILFGDVNTRWPVPEKVTLSMQLQRNHVHCSSAFRRSYWAQVGGIDEGMPCWEDYEFWIRFSEAGARITRIPGDHFFYRKHGPSRSSESGQVEKAMQSYIRHKHKHLFEYQ